MASVALGVNPWVMVAAPEYLAQRGAPREVADLADHACIVYSSVQGNDVWRFLGPEGPYESAQLNAPLRSNNLSVVLAAARAGMGLAILPHYVAAPALAAGASADRDGRPRTAEPAHPGGDALAEARAAQGRRCSSRSCASASPAPGGSTRSSPTAPEGGRYSKSE